MTPRQKIQIANAILAIAMLILIVRILGMLNVIPWMHDRSIVLFVFPFILLAGALRRSGRADMKAPPPSA